MEMRRFEFTEYDVTDCRFGRLGKGEDRRWALVETVSGFHDWIQSAKHLAQTKIESPGNELYVKESANAGALYGLVLWKRTGVESAVCAINADDPPKAETKVKVRKFDKNDIPGEPLYFVVNPRAGRLFSVRTSSVRQVGKAELIRSMQFFMGIRSKRVRSRQTLTDDGPSESICSSSGTPARKPVFRVRVKRRRSVLDRVLENPDQIKTLVHTIPFKDISTHQRLLILRPLLKFFHEDLGGENFERARSVTYAISVGGMQRSDVEKAIESQETAAPGQKVGFRLTKSNQTIWADECLSRRTVELELDSENGVFSAADILRVAGETFVDWL